MEYNLSELKKKQVINVKDGKKLGKICDVEICFPSSSVTNFIISPSMNFLCGEQIKISPCEIEKIGEDAILVKEKRSGCKAEDEYDD